VFGPNTAFLAGTQLAGAVIGVRGSVLTRMGGFAYDLFAGTPAHRWFRWFCRGKGKRAKKRQYK